MRDGRSYINVEKGATFLEEGKKREKRRGDNWKYRLKLKKKKYHFVGVTYFAAEKH